MTKITAGMVQRLAALSAIKIDEAELASISGELTKIIDYINQLATLDTSGVEPTYQVGDFDKPLREDVIQESPVTRSELLALAPESKDNQIKVPKVL